MFFPSIWYIVTKCTDFFFWLVRKNDFTDRSNAVLLLWFIFICCYIYNVCLLHDSVATLILSALSSALYFVFSKLAL